MKATMTTYPDGKAYQVTATGTHYHAETSGPVIDALESARYREQRVRVWLGDTKTGKCWHDEHDVTGRIGRSTGPRKIPLLVHNARSLGGPHILDHCIIAIADTATGRKVYQHPALDLGTFEQVPPVTEGYAEAVTIDGELHAQFRKPGQAARWIAFMRGERFSK